jgi:putative NADH-flavin reductase
MPLIVQRGIDMNILIIGSTGGTGRQLVLLALERGHNVTAFARRASKVNIEHNRLKVIEGNVLDTESVNKVMLNQEAVLSALGHKRWFYPTNILSKGTSNIIEAMEKNKVRRLICETSLGIGESFGKMGLYYTLFVIPFILPFYFWDKRKQELVIRSSSLDWTIVRPGALNNKKARGKYLHGSKVGNWIYTVRISRADVADFMLNQLEDNKYVHSAPGICW